MPEEEKTVTTQSNTTPWAGQQPYLQAGFQQGLSNLQGPNPQYYPGSTVVPFSSQSNQGLNALETRAGAGSPTLGAANSYAQNVLGGQYLNGGNPEFGNMVNQIGMATRPSIDATFASAGRYGSGAHSNSYADALTRQAGQLAFQNYGQERGMQQQMAGLAPQLAQADYLDPQMMLQAGGLRERQAGLELGDQMNRWNFDQNLPAQKLAQYMATVGGGSYGSNTVNSQPVYSNPWATGLGAGLQGLGALGSLFGGR